MCDYRANNDLRTSRAALFELVELGAIFPVLASARANVSSHAIIKGQDSCDAWRDCDKLQWLVVHHQFVGSIEHNVIVGHCHISTGAILNGGVYVGSGTFIGGGAVVHHGIKVGKIVLLGADM